MLAKEKGNFGRALAFRKNLSRFKRDATLSGINRLKDEKPKNLVASIHQRLLNHAKLSKDEPQLVLMRFGLERLLYRLSVSEHSAEFVVKGAMLFLVWIGEPHR